MTLFIAGLLSGIFIGSVIVLHYVDVQKPTTNNGGESVHYLKFLPKYRRN